jgi:2-(1,2-epoxy-1,2-dihydrophenyl)acetyl-CoA isomerase
MIPASGGSYLFPAVVGPGKAFEMCVLEQDMTAEQAQEAGLVTRVCADTDLVDEASALANRLASGPTLAFMRTKELVNNFISGSNLEHHLHMELKFQKEMARTADFAEGVTAFTEKRKPRFTGR